MPAFVKPLADCVNGYLFICNLLFVCAPKSQWKTRVAPLKAMFPPLMSKFLRP